MISIYQIRGQAQIPRGILFSWAWHRFHFPNLEGTRWTNLTNLLISTQMPVAYADDGPDSDWNTLESTIRVIFKTRQLPLRGRRLKSRFRDRSDFSDQGEEYREVWLLKVSFEVGVRSWSQFRHICVFDPPISTAAIACSGQAMAWSAVWLINCLIDWFLQYLAKGSS